MYKKVQKVRLFILSKFWAPWRVIERRHHSRMRQDNVFFVVLGVPRSGTSLLCRLLEASGVHFGRPEEMKRPNQFNPIGFYEYKNVMKISSALLRQAGHKTPYDAPSRSLRARTWYHRLFRVFSIIQFQARIVELSARGERVGLKLTAPAFYYLLGQYIPNVKMVCIFREPTAASYSNINRSIYGLTFPQTLAGWPRANLDLIYHASLNESIVVEYGDLLDEKTRQQTLEKIVSFVGGGKVEALGTLIEEPLNRSDKTTERLRETYPLPRETRVVLDALRAMKRRTHLKAS